MTDKIHENHVERVGRSELDATKSELESRLIAQEHRLFHVLANYFVHRRQWCKDDPRRSAALVALIWRFCPGPTFIAAGGTLAAVFTIMLLFWQGRLIDDQNTLFREQNDYFREQNTSLRQQIAREHRSRLIAALYDQHAPSLESENDQARPKADARTRREALIAFINMERDASSASPGVPLQRPNLRKALLSDVDLSGLDLRNIDFAGASFRAATLRSSDLRGSNLSDADLRRAELANSNLSGASLVRADLEGAAFVAAILQQCNLTEANVRHTTFLGSDLRQSTLGRALHLEEVSWIADANLEGVWLPSSVYEVFTDRGALCYRDTKQWLQRIRSRIVLDENTVLLGSLESPYQQYISQCEENSIAPPFVLRRSSTFELIDPKVGGIGPSRMWDGCGCGRSHLSRVRRNGAVRWRSQEWVLKCAFRDAAQLCESEGLVEPSASIELIDLEDLVGQSIASQNDRH